MFLSRASERSKIPISFAATRKVPLLCLLAFIIAVAIAATIWATIRTKDTMFSIPLLILLVLLSVAEGALACAIWRVLTKKHEDYERQDTPRSSTHSLPPAFAISPRNSALRNFSLPRERCLDASPVITTRPLPIPPPYVAKGIFSSVPGAVRPLPAPPVEYNLGLSSLNQDKMVGEFIIQPLKIRKTSSCSMKLGAVPEHLSFHPTADAMSSVGPISILRVRESWPITTNCSSHEASQEDVPETAGSNEELTATLIVEEAPAYLPLSRPLEHLTVPSIQVQRPTPTPSVAPDSPKAPIIATSRTSTIRVVSCHLEVPEKIHHGSLRRKWAGQHGFISL